MQRKSYKLGFKIDGIPLDDLELKLIACYCMGLDNKEISGILRYRTTYLCNIACRLYAILGTGSSPQSLARKGRANGFDDCGKFKGQQVLDDLELSHLKQLAPRLIAEI